MQRAIITLSVVSDESATAAMLRLAISLQFAAHTVTKGAPQNKGIETTESTWATFGGVMASDPSLRLRIFLDLEPTEGQSQGLKRPGESHLESS
jgi:hypothetical protein